MSAGTLFLGIQGIQGTGKEIRHLGNTPSKEKTKERTKESKEKGQANWFLAKQKGSNGRGLRLLYRAKAE